MRTKSSNLLLWDPPKTGRSRRSEAIKALRGQTRFHTFPLAFLFLDWKQPIYRAFVPEIRMQRSTLKGDYLTSADRTLIVSLLYWTCQYDRLPSAKDTFWPTRHQQFTGEQIHIRVQDVGLRDGMTTCERFRSYGLEFRNRIKVPADPVPAPAWLKAEIN